MTRSLQQKSTRTLMQLRQQAVSARQQLRMLQLIPCISKAPHHCTRERSQSSSAKWTDSGDCTSLQRRGWRVVWKIHEIQAWEVWAYHEKTRIKCLLQHFPLSNIACCNLAQDKIIFIWVALRRKRTIRAEKDRKKQLAKEAALASQSLASAAVWIFIILIGFWRHKSVNMLKYAKTKYAPWHVCKNSCEKKYAKNMLKYAKPNMHKYAF